MNLHTIRDQPPNSNRRLQQERNNPQNVQDNGLPWGGFAPSITDQQLRYAEQNRVLFVSGRMQIKNPREQNYWDMLVYTFCPTFQCLSLTIFLIVVDIAMFIAEIAVGINYRGDFLEIQTQSLRKLGGNYGPDVAKGEVYRLIAAIFLHINFIHIIANILSTFILVTRVEYTFGPIKTLIIYLLSGIGGNIFSLAVSSDEDYALLIKAGASTALFGMIGLLLGYLIINWNGLDLVGQQLKCSIICTTVFFLIFVLIFTPSSSGKIDYYGHLGGFLTGIWMTAIQRPLIYETRQKVIRIAYVLCFIGQFAGTFGGFYSKHKAS